MFFYKMSSTNWVRLVNFEATFYENPDIGINLEQKSFQEHPGTIRHRIPDRAEVPGSTRNTKSAASFGILDLLVQIVVLISSLAIIIEQVSKTSMSQAKNWCFTLNNYTQLDVDRLTNLGSSASYIVFGREVGQNGTPHLQGFIAFNQRKRLAQVKALIGGNPHVEVCRNIPASVQYCKKDGDFEEVGELPNGQGRRSDIDAFKEAVKGGLTDIKEIRELHSEVYSKHRRFVYEYLADHAPDKALADHDKTPWQLELDDILDEEPEDRKVIFVVDYRGNAGKSWYAHHYTKNHEGCQVMLPGKKADMAYALESHIRVLFVDAPRSKQSEFLQYDFFEDVKNGYVFSTKYESRVKQLNKCHVVVMMNEDPDMTKLSQDRYHIILAGPRPIDNINI